MRAARMIDSGLVGTTRAEDARGAPTQSPISSDLLVYEDDIIQANVIYHQLY